MGLTALWWWIDRWRKSTAFMDMTLEEQGAYRNLLDEAHLRGGYLPIDERILAKACGDALAWSRVRVAVLAKFTTTDRGYYNETLALVLHESERRATNQRRYRERLANDRDNGRGNAANNNANNNHDSPSPSPSPSPDQSPSSHLKDLRNQKEQASTSGEVSRTNGNGAYVSSPIPINGTTDKELGERAGRFCEHYAELYPVHRKGARYLAKPALDWPKAIELCRTWDDARLEKLAIVFLKTDHDFAVRGSRTIGQFSALASWCDDRLREVESGGR